MKYSDDQLSAFLDSELSPIEMEAIRGALAEDERLADRLAELAQVDATLAQVYGAIDEQPLPRSVTTLLRPEEPGSGNLVPFPIWQRLDHGIRRHAALAASIALAVGIGLGALLPATTKQSSWAQITAIIETQPSGVTIPLDDNRSVTPKLTFQDRQGNYCRIVAVASDSGAREQLACRREGQWRLDAQVSLDKDGEALYRPASGGSPLDGIVDALIAEGPYDRQHETDLIEKTWRQ